MIDGAAFEQQFLDHMAPVWRLLPPQHRGRLLVDPALMDRAAYHGLDAIPTTRPPHTVLQPKPRFDGPPALVASYGDIKEARRLGYGPFAFLEHGAAQTYPSRGRGHSSYSGGLDREDNELVMVPNEYSAAKWRASYPNVRIAIVGCPKIDTLPRREPGPGPTVAISFHWPAPLSISGYAGTALGDYLPALPALAKAFNVIGHAHPKGDWPERMQRTYRRAGIPFVADFEDVCRQADVFVADNTSCLFEFAATGRPVVVLNAALWAKARGKDPNPPGLRFWDAAHVGINVDRQQDLVTAVHEALSDPIERQVAREDALRFVYGLRTNGAVAAATAITDWLASRQAVAA